LTLEANLQLANKAHLSIAKVDIRSAKQPTIARNQFKPHNKTAMSEHTYKFNVAMSCGGCSGAITRVLNKLDGKYTFAPTSGTKRASLSPCGVESQNRWLTLP